MLFVKATQGGYYGIGGYLNQINYQIDNLYHKMQKGGTSGHVQYYAYA